VTRNPDKSLSLAFTDRLAELGIAPSVGSRGDSYDNALAVTADRKPFPQYSPPQTDHPARAGRAQELHSRKSDQGSVGERL
jgi:hypothetical protein